MSYFTIDKLKAKYEKQKEDHDIKLQLKQKLLESLLSLIMTLERKDFENNLFPNTKPTEAERKKAWKKINVYIIIDTILF